MSVGERVHSRVNESVRQKGRGGVFLLHIIIPSSLFKFYQRAYPHYSRPIQTKGVGGRRV